jgi:hypothetical protein
MEEQLVGFEVAKLAKTLGFKLGSGWQIRSLYNLKDGETFCEKTKETPDYACERCTQSLLQRWLREVHQIHVSSFPIMKERYFYSVSIIQNKSLKIVVGSPYDPKNVKSNYEESFEDGLMFGLNLIK